MALREEQDGCKDGAEDVGNSQGSPYAVEAVPSQVGENHGKEETHRDEEDDLS